MSFNLNDYDQVDSRIKKFYNDHPGGRILTELSNSDIEKRACFKAMLYVNDKLVSTGWAYEERTASDFVNKDCWLENAETSAIGRCLANYNYSGNKRPSQTEMDKANRMKNQSEKPIEKPEQPETESIDVNVQVKLDILTELIKNDALSQAIIDHVNNKTIPKIKALSTSEGMIKALDETILKIKDEIAKGDLSETRKQFLSFMEGLKNFKPKDIDYYMERYNNLIKNGKTELEAVDVLKPEANQLNSDREVV